MMESKNYDAVIIGAGLSGLVCAYTLSSYGVKCCLIEKSAVAGGGNQSFTNDTGDVFDSGYHALDYMRSAVTTNLFKKVLNDEYYEYTLNRGLVMNGEVFPYNLPIDEWPNDIVSLSSVSDIDEISGEITKEKLSTVYGKDFVEFCFDNVLASYPSELRAIKEGRPVSSSIGMIYPWFFPNIKKIEDANASEWASYHGQMRDKKQTVLYPKNQGFYGFIDGLLNAIDKKYCDVFLGCDDIDIILDGNKQCNGVKAKGYHVKAGDYFWCAPFFGLAGMLGLSMPKGVGQTLVLGSFKFNGNLDNKYQEILVGDKNFKINRISFPGLIRSELNNLIQVEFLFPTDEIDMSKDQWMDHWLDCLNKLGLSEGLDISSYRFDIQPKGMVTKDPLDEISKDYAQRIRNSGTNIMIHSVNAGPENINRIVPSVIENTMKYILNK